eukprot:349730-Chlamydomonas_euryale.AAC.3
MPACKARRLGSERLGCRAPRLARTRKRPWRGTVRQTHVCAWLNRQEAVRVDSVWRDGLDVWDRPAPPLLSRLNKW